jgi:hypothetical protein
MGVIQYEAGASDDERRARLYEGDLFVYGPRSTTVALCTFARELIEAAFKPLDPERAQYELPVERYAEVLAELKPSFIHHPESKRLIQAILRDFDCDPERVYFDVPRLRSSTSDGYLTTGIAYAFHPHRDTWYSAPRCQINWWTPIYPLAPDNGVAFHPRYWSEDVANSSEVYDYGEWNANSRFNAAQHIGKDTRVQPRAAQSLDLSDEVRVVTPVGGMTLFSAAQMHASVANTSGRTRFSLDFRTVHRGDAEAGRGAPNVDSRCTGTTMGDYLRASDLQHLPAELIARFEAGVLR